MKWDGLALDKLFARPLYRRLAVGALMLVFALQLVHVARVYSATWDEPHHLYDGYTVWTKHDFRLNPEVPPLVKLTAALPLLGMHLYAPPDQGRSEPMEAFLDGRAFVFDNGGDRVLFPARMACMLFALVLALTIYAAARRMFGDTAGLIALGLFIFDPTVLANGTLVTTDVGSACLIFGAVYAFYRYARDGQWRWLLLTGLVTGLAFVTKFTGILMVPMLLLLAVAEGLRGRSWALLGRRLAASAGILLCGWVIVWAFYGFRYKAGAPGTELKPELQAYIASMPNPHDAAVLSAVAKMRLLPEPYLWGLANTKKTEWEFVAYFFGKIYRHGPWEYFPAAFLIKSTLPLLILLALLPVFSSGLLRQYKREAYFLFLPVAVYFAVITSSHFDIGARHMIPLYPFLYVAVAGGAALMLRKGGAWTGVVALLMVWQVVTSARVAPAYMAYGNEAWGGPPEVHRYLSDANTDWAQQLKAVKQYLDTNNVTNCWFAYFADGAIQPSDYSVNCKRLPTVTSLWWLNLPMDVPPVIEGTVLISDSDLQGVEGGDGPLNPYNDFRGRTPDAVIQGGVNVYRGSFDVPLASALVETRRSGQLAAAGDRKDALATAEDAAALAPGSAIVQLNLADQLKAQGRRSEALEHYRTAKRLVQNTRPALDGDDLLPRITAGCGPANC